MICRLLGATVSTIFCAGAAQALTGFSDVTVGVGAATTHGVVFGPYGEPDMMSGGIGVGDIDGDGRVDIVVLRGDLGPAKLFVNQGGIFADDAAARGFVLNSGLANGVLVADVDGDGDADILVGGLYIGDANYTSPPRLWRNDGSGNFVEDATAFSGWDGFDSWSAALGDADGDGDLDLALGRWTKFSGGRAHLLRNDGTGHFAVADAVSGLTGQFSSPNDHSFTPNFADIDGDGKLDLLYTGDFGSSRIFLQGANGVFTNVTSPAVITDENGMGAAVGDYDNDGDLDWFVSSIYDPGTPAGNWGATGNRLYRNDGNGTFTDVTTAAGVRDGGWGWGSCFADFNADGFPDLYMVNGMMGNMAATFNNDAARLFMSNGDGTFTEAAATMGVADTGQGRGIACFDYDGDGAIDIFVQNGYGATRLFHNEIPGAQRTVAVRLHGRSGNRDGVGARVWLTGAAGEQMREIAAGSHFLSNDPPLAYFGLGSANAYGSLRVRWPDGSQSASGYRPGTTRRIDADLIFDTGAD